MKFLFDFFPIVAFYLTYNYGKEPWGEVTAMIAATAVLMAATTVQMLYTWIKHKKIEKMHVVVLVLALVFGSATIYFREPAYLIWKVTIVNWLFAIAFAASHFIGHKTIIRHMMDHAITLPDTVWSRLSIMWIIFFTALGAINLIVAARVDFDHWVDFKLFGLLGLTLVFVVIQGFYLARHIKEPS